MKSRKNNGSSLGGSLTCLLLSLIIIFSLMPPYQNVSAEETVFYLVDNDSDFQYNYIQNVFVRGERYYFFARDQTTNTELYLVTSTDGENWTARYYIPNEFLTKEFNVYMGEPNALGVGMIGIVRSCDTGVHLDRFLLIGTYNSTGDLSWLNNEAMVGTYTDTGLGATIVRAGDGWWWVFAFYSGGVGSYRRVSYSSDDNGSTWTERDEIYSPNPGRGFAYSWDDPNSASQIWVMERSEGESLSSVFLGTWESANYQIAEYVLSLDHALVADDAENYVSAVQDNTGDIHFFWKHFTGSIYQIYHKIWDVSSKTESEDILVSEVDISAYGGSPVYLYDGQIKFYYRDTSDQIALRSTDDYGLIWSSPSFPFNETAYFPGIISTDQRTHEVLVGGDLREISGFAYQYQSGGNIYFAYDYLASQVAIGVGIENALVVYDPEFSVYDTWLFAGKTYVLNINYSLDEGYQYLYNCRVRFNDGKTTVSLTYDNQNDSFSIDSGSEAIHILDWEASNISSSTLLVSWTFSLETREILDSYNITLYGKVSEVLTDTDLDWFDLEAYFNIYNEGGLTKYLFTGDAERIPGGDILDLRIGTDYVPADIFADEFENGFFSSAWDIWDNGTSRVDVVNFWSIGIDPRTGFTDPWGIELTSTSGYPDNDYAWARLYYPSFESASNNYVVEFYLQLNDNASHYNWIDFEDGNGVIKASIEFGYASDFFIYLYNQTGGNYINTTVGWLEDTWFKVNVNFSSTDVGGGYRWNYDVYINDVVIANVTNAFLTSYGSIFQPQRIYFFAHGGVGQEKTMYIDSLKIWSDWAGGTGGTAIAKVHYVNLQAFHSSFEFKIPYGDEDLSALTGDIPNNCYVEFTLEYINQNLVWEEGPTLRIEPIDGRSSGENQWVSLWVQHIFNGSTVNAREIYAFWEGLGGDKDYFRLWIDLWTSQINSSTTYGLRTNSFYYGVQDVSNPWFRWLTGSDWGIMGQREDLTGGYGSYLNSSGSVVSASVFPMTRIKVLLWREANLDFEVQVVGWSDVAYKRTGLNDPMRGVQTPIYTAPLMPNLPSGNWFMGLVNWILSGFQTMMVGFITLWENATLYFVETIIPLVDSFLYWIYPALGPGAFTAFIVAFNSLLSQFALFVEYFITLLGYVVSMLSQVMLFIASIFGYVISVFISVIDIWMQFITMVLSIFQGGYGVGVNIWTEWAGQSWFTLMIIFYPMFLFEACTFEGSLRPLESHLIKWKDVFAFIFDMAHKLYNIVIGTISFIVESIPVVE